MEVENDVLYMGPKVIFSLSWASCYVRHVIVQNLSHIPERAFSSERKK